MLASSLIKLTSYRDGQIVRLAFDTGSPANALTMELLDEFHRTIAEIRRHSPRVLIITGRADNFSRGADLKKLPEMGEEFKSYIASEFDLFGIIDDLPFITIAALTGTCIGNAAEMVLACDFRLATQSAKFSLPEVAIGFIAPSQRIRRFLGIGVVKEILLDARMLSAEDCKSLGLVTRVFADAEFDASVLAFAEEYAERAPLAMRATKKGIALSYGYGHADYSHEREAAYATYCSDDGKEGFASIREKRKPVFRGC